MPRNLAGPIVFVALGLILALAVADYFDGVDLRMIGWIIAGAGLVWGLYVAFAGRGEPVATRRVVRRPATDVVEEEPPARRRVVRDEVTEVDEV